MKWRDLLKILILIECFTFSAFAVDQKKGTKEEFRVKRREVDARYKDFYQRKERLKLDRNRREQAAHEESKLRQSRELELQRIRKKYRRPAQISDVKGAEIFAQKIKREKAAHTKVKKDYVNRIKSIRSAREGHKKIPELEEMSIEEYPNIIWSKEKAPEKQRQ